MLKKDVERTFEGIVNLDILKERFSKDLIKATNDIESLKKRIGNKNFIEKAPQAIVDECQSKLKQANLHFASIKRKLEMLE